MITLDFKVEPRTVVLHLLNAYYPDRHGEEPSNKAADTLLATAKRLDLATLALIHNGLDADNFTNLCASKKVTLPQIGARIDQLVKALEMETATAELLDQTARALSSVREEWEHNYFKSHEILSYLTGLSLNRAFRVYITHPCVPQGFNDFRGNIFWTLTAKKNSNTIYLWHEIMHYYVDLEHKYDEQVSHSIVQLLTDEELRIRLNGGTYTPEKFHIHLQESEAKLLPSWQSYINQKGKKNIDDFIRQADQLLKENSKS